VESVPNDLVIGHFRVPEGNMIGVAGRGVTPGRLSLVDR
jgi:hypothetical protein